MLMRRISAPSLCITRVEAFSVASWFLWPRFSSSELGSFLWGSQLILLMPGSIAVGEFIEDALWRSGISPVTMNISILVLSVALNAFLFWLVMRIFTRLRVGRRSNTSLERTRER
jgi:hypothetical protein